MIAEKSNVSQKILARGFCREGSEAASQVLRCAETTRKVNVRIIAARNRDLRYEVTAQHF
jgi:hypothetical protein